MSNLTGKLPPHSLLQGRYLIVDLVGQGGMGAVYKAVDTLSKQYVAIKELSQAKLPTRAELEKAKVRFRREADMLRSLDHPNLPHFYTSFEENDRLYLIMDFIEGQTLWQMLQAHNGYPLPVEDVVNYTCQLCDVLSYLHRQFPQIIFRDLKPSNVMVTADGHVYLIDFGIARFFQPGKHSDTEAFGSLAYAAPEQLDGKQTSVVSDLYSLGATLHHCLTGKMPAYAQNRYRYPSARSLNALVTPDLDRLLASLVEVKEQKRPKSADAVLSTMLRIKQQVKEQTRKVATHNSIPGSISSSWLNLNGSTPQGQIKLSGNSLDPNADTSDINNPFPSPAQLPWLNGLPTSVGQWFVSHQVAGVAGTDIRNGAALIGSELAQGYASIRNWSSRVLTRHFVGILLLRMILLIGLTVYAVRLSGSYTIVAFGLALLLLFITSSASSSTRVRDASARSLLFCTAFATILTCIALQTAPEVQAILHTSTSSQFLSILLVATACISLLRTTNRLAWLDHVTLVLVTAIGMLLQYTLFYQELPHLPGLTSDMITISEPVRYSLTFTLAFIAVFFLCRIARPFSAFDRFMMVLVATIYASLQFTLGFDELQHLWIFAQMSSSSNTLLYAGYTYVGLIAVPLISTLIALCIGQRYPLANRIAIFFLAITSALLQAALASNVELSLPTAPAVQPLTLRLVDLFASNQFFMYACLSVASILLIIRLGRSLVWLERLLLFLLAGVCALLQSAFWADQLSLPSGQFGSSVFSQVSLIAFNQLLASSLLLLAIVSITIPVINIFVRVARSNTFMNQKATTLEHHFKWVQGLAKLVDRLIILGIMLISTLLVGFFGNQSQLLAQPISLQSQTVMVNQIMTGILALLTMVALFRLGGRFNRWDCITLLVAIIADTVLTYGNIQVQKIAPPLLSTLQQFTSTVLSGNGPQLLLLIGLLTAVGISLLWLRRTPPRRDIILIVVLFVSFASALLCILLHYIWPVLLLVAFLILIHGIFVAIQMERVR